VGGNDEVSAITSPTMNINQGNTSSGTPSDSRMNATVSLDNVSQALIRRRNAGAYTIVSRQYKSARVHKNDEIKLVAQN